MKLRSLVFPVLFVILSALSASHAYGASYAPTLMLPNNGATGQTPDALVCNWVPDMTPSHYLVRWATSPDFTNDLLFEYKTNSTSYTVNGLPGLMTIYWQVSGVDSSGAQYKSATFSFDTADDNEYAGEYYEISKKLTFEDGSTSPSGWTNYYTGSYSYFSTNSYSGNRFMYHYGYYRNYYPNSHAFFEMTSPITLTAVRMQLSYDWAHYQYSTSSTEKLIVEIKSTVDNVWKTLYDHAANNNNYYWTGGSYSSYPYSFKNQKISLTSYTGQTVYLRFHIDTGTYQQASIFLDNIVVGGHPGYSGTDRNVVVSSAYGSASPAGVATYLYADQATLKMNDVYHYNNTLDRYIINGFTGTGSIPVSGSTGQITTRIYRTSSITWLWKRQFSIKVSTWNNLGSPSPAGVTWVDLNATQLFQVTVPIEQGYTDGTRWICTGFTGTGDVPQNGTASSVSVKVTQPGTLSWKWNLQYRLTIANRAGVPANVGNIAPVAGEYWFFSGQTQNVSASSFFDQGDGTSFVNRGWIGTGSVVSSNFPTGTVTITMPSTFTWQWDKQVFLTINSEKGQVTGSPPGWYVEGSEVNLGVQSPFIESETVRYVVPGWTSNYASGGSIEPGNGTTIPPTKLYAPTTITWSWIIQYLVSFETNYGTVAPPFAWVDVNGTVTATAVKPDVTSSEDYAWFGWTGTSNGLDPDLPSGDPQRDFTNITAPAVFSAHWSAQFMLEVVAQNGSLAEDYTGFRDEFSFVDITAVQPTADPGTRWVPGWAGTGNGSVTLAPSPSNPSTVTVQILEPIHQEVYWVIQYLFQILDPTGLGHPLPAVGDYWYYNDESVSGSVEYFNGLFLCDGFTGTGSAPASSALTYYSFTINQPSSVSFRWKEPTVISARLWTNARQVTSAINGRTVEMERMSDNAPFIVFHNPVSGTIEAAYYRDGLWVTETIDIVGTNDIGIALVLDRFDVPYVAYQDRDSNALKFASLDAGGWMTEIIAEGSGVGTSVDMQIAPDGTVGVMYYDSNQGSLNYAYFNLPGKVDGKQSWSVHLVDDAGNVGGYCSLFYTDSNSEPRVAYYDSTNGALKIASLYLGDTAWTVETVTDDSGDFGINSTLVLDPAGFAVICYRENTVSINSQGLIFAREMPQGWQVYALDNEGVTGFDACMAIDGLGYPHVSYNDFGNMYYAFYNGVSWVINVIATGDVGYDTALSLDENGNAAVSYWNNGSLYYADVVDNKFDGEIINRYTDTGPSINDALPSGGGGGCFIATAAFSSINAQTVQSLCAFRDSSVATSSNGENIVTLYYALSPAIADSLNDSFALRSVMRAILKDK